jgi:hypothetical protein
MSGGWREKKEETKEEKKEAGLKAGDSKEGEKAKRDFIPQNARDGAEFSLRRPTLSQERKRKKKVGLLRSKRR